jgi:hypothetical protein
MAAVPQTTQVQALPNENEMFALTHQMRLRVLDDMFGGAKNILPEDPADRKTIAGLLKDIDAQALGRMRIKVDEKANTSQEEAAGIIAQILAATGGHSPFKLAKPLNREAPVLPSDIPAPILVEGETSTIVSTTNFDDFMAKNGGNLPPAEE